MFLFYIMFLFKLTDWHNTGRRLNVVIEVDI